MPITQRKDMLRKYFYSAANNLMMGFIKSLQR